MEQSMEGKVALITGGGTGLGAAVARRLASNGASIVVTGRREGLIKTIAEETGGLAVAGDVTDSGHLDRAVNLAVEEFGGLDVVIANAGVISTADVASIKEGDWQQLIDINLTGVMLTAKAALPAMTTKGGAIVNVSSIAGMMGVNDAAGYCATKAALLGLTRSMAMDYGQHGIRVNAVAPTIVMTELAVKAWSDPAKSQPMLVRHPIGRFAEVEDVASAIAMILSEDSSMVTGTILPIDGGFLSV